MLFGVDEMLLAAVATGVTAAVGSTYNFAAPLFLKIAGAAQRGDFHEARKWQSKAVALCRTVANFGGIAAAKAVMGMIGVDCGGPRLPLAPLKDHDVKELRAELEELGYFAWRRGE